MVYKKLEIEGIGKVLYQPIKVQEQETEDVSADGQPVERCSVGERAKTVYKLGDGTEIPSTQVCKKFVVDGEDIIMRKFKLTEKIGKDEIEYLDDKNLVYGATERKFYTVTTESSELKKLVLGEGKTLLFPFSAGNGFKVWNAALTSWNGSLAMVLIRGNVDKAYEMANDVEPCIQVDILPEQTENKKKLLKAIAVM